jgi:hypothetical protein
LTIIMNLFHKICAIFGGLAVIWTGFEILFKGGYRFRGYYSDFSDNNILIGSIVLFLGFFLIIFSLKQKKPPEKVKNEEDSDQN